MRKSLIIAVLALAVAAAVLVGLVSSQSKPKAPEPEAQPSVAEAAAPAETLQSNPHVRPGLRRSVQTQPEASSVAMPAATANLITNWEDKVDEVLGSTASDSDKATQMLALFPYLPPEGQEEVARHVSNLLPNQDYGLMHNYLTNSDLPENVLDVLLADALNRPNSLKLPALLDLARNEQNPEAAEAKDFLELLLDQDYGTNWDQWQAGVDAWLKDNPD